MNSPRSSATPIARKRRVAVTGLGIVSPLGTGIQKNWTALMEGKSGIDRISQFDSSKFTSQIAGEVRDFNPEDYVDKKEARRMERFSQFAVAAARMALDDSRLVLGEAEAPRSAVVIGVGMGGLSMIEKTHATLVEKGPGRVSPFFIPLVIPNMAAGHVSIQLGARGPNLCTTTACAAGSHAIGEAFRLIQNGTSDIAFGGGAESVVCPLAVAGFASMKALSTRNDEPQKASRPFEKDRDGFILAEGGAVLVLEEWDHAVKRGAKIRAELVGYGLTGDAYHMTSPAPEGEGAARCMQMALDDAQVGPEAVDYINAHGTSTEYNDMYETAAIKKVFGLNAARLAVSSTKSMTGHPLGAAGAIEAVYTVLAIQNAMLPPTINYDSPDPKCDLDYIPNKPRPREIHFALSNSFGFGGTNACLLFKHPS